MTASCPRMHRPPRSAYSEITGRRPRSSSLAIPMRGNGSQQSILLLKKTLEIGNAAEGKLPGGGPRDQSRRASYERLVRDVEGKSIRTHFGASALDGCAGRVRRAVGNPR